MSRSPAVSAKAALVAGTGAALASMAAVFAAVVVALLAVLPLGGAPGSATGPDGPRGAPAAAVGGIPAQYLAAFDGAAARFGVPWSVLAGIYRVECDFGRSTLPGCPPGTRNSAGAEGPGQFLPGTWRRGLALGTIIAPGPPAPDGGGYATDGDGDGVADPWDPFDAVASTARLLAASGATRDLSGAVFAYNHDPGYVTQVLALAAGYQRDRAAFLAAPVTAPRSPAPAAVAAVLAFARAQLGLPYRWGGAGPASWDCSGLVQAAYAAGGILLSHDAAAQYSATAARRVPLDRLQAGDLVFYGASAATIHHVGIAIDAGRMIDAPHTGAVVRVDPVGASDELAATRPLG